MKLNLRSFAFPGIAAVLTAGVMAFYGLKESSNSPDIRHPLNKAPHLTSHPAAESPVVRGTAELEPPVGGTRHEGKTSAGQTPPSPGKTSSAFTRSRFPARQIATPPESVHPGTAGAQIASANHSITVESFTPLSGQPGPALTIVIEQPDAQTSATPAVSGQPPASRSRHAGFNHEEELFRTRWGWAAHEAVRRAAQEEAQTNY